MFQKLYYLNVENYYFYLYDDSTWKKQNFFVAAMQTMNDFVAFRIFREHKLNQRRVEKLTCLPAQFAMIH